MNKIIKGMAVAALMTSANMAAAGGYVAGSIGSTDLNVSGFDKGTSVSITGGYRVNENFAFEASYLDLGESSDNITPVWTISGDGITFSALGIMPINEQFSLYGRAGVFLWDASLDETGSGEIASDDGTDLVLGAGVSYAITNNVELTAEYQRLEFDGEDIDNVSAGIRFFF